MNIREKSNQFLSSLGFRLNEELLSASFGDFSDTYSNKNIYLRVLSDRSVVSIDVSSLEGKEEWFDLDLIKILISNEQDLVKVMAHEELCHFLEIHISEIYDLFSERNYCLTKKRLKLLENERAKQLFPNH